MSIVKKHLIYDMPPANENAEISIFWFRRDLRLNDNTALHHALASGTSVLPVFIFDENILGELERDDPRVNFIHRTLESIHGQLVKMVSSLLCLKGNPMTIWKGLIGKYEIRQVYFNRDYEPYALDRDEKIEKLLTANRIGLKTYKDHVIFEPNEILKKDGSPYTVYTPYKNKWLENFNAKTLVSNAVKDNFQNFHTAKYRFPTLSEIGFHSSPKKIKEIDFAQLDEYDQVRDFPKRDTTHLGPHLRFGTVSIRKIISKLSPSHATFLSELIWREFFVQILFHFPFVVHRSFKVKYDNIEWRNNESEFQLWCEGKTGYPMVDAGMRQLNATGYMHNRVRMVTASFLCKHLLIDWRWGEAYFAKHLMDYELASNNGNWQWVAGTGCDAAPYFRVFNPSEQLKKFDKELEYIKKWIPEYGKSSYSEPMVDHKMARNRALETYKHGLERP